MRSVATILMSTLLLVPAASASAQPVAPQPPPAPVAISACRGGISSIELIEIAAYDVTLRNTTTVSADLVRVSVRYGRHQKHATFDVTGPFAPGADVNRHLRRTVSGGLFAYRSDQNDCAVDYVHFTNGTSWNRPIP